MYEIEEMGICRMFDELFRELSNTEVFWDSLQRIKENISANTVILWIMMIFLVIGGVDKLRGNKLGYGEKFEEAFVTMKPLALGMISGHVCRNAVGGGCGSVSSGIGDGGR